MFIKKKFSRNKFLKSLGIGSFLFGVGIVLKKIIPASKKKYPFAGKIHNQNHHFGHRIRKGFDEVPRELKKIETLIIGGGISGLSAGWWFNRKGYKNYHILELEKEIGGNSFSGKNEISSYPWGAHYVPLPWKGAAYVKLLFEDLGVIKSYKNNLPVYNEYYLCSDPHERLFFQGKWQEGLVPAEGIPERELEQIKEFFKYLHSLKKKSGSDRKPIFAIPLELSSRDIEFTRLDKISMYEFMISKGWNSAHLLWYINYCCRDDYGSPIQKVSAWAGLHYFASRTGTGANADSQTVITWPEGNGWLVKKLSGYSEGKISTATLAYKIHNHKNGKVYVDTISQNSNQLLRYEANQIIYCGPRYTAAKIIKGYSDNTHKVLDFVPWLVANISLQEKPGGSGAGLSWDNVSYYSKSLGYIFANHQDLTYHRKKGVITYYLPLSEGDPKQERIRAYSRSYDDWIDIILPDIKSIHPGIEKNIISIDIRIWGHGMVSPGINFLWNHKRQKLLQSFGNIYFAHTDMSGISIFEEAQYRGCEAAEQILRKL